ncbi:MAG: hypothetical protein ACH346_04630 [Chthoniobacterales bacterium]
MSNSITPTNGSSSSQATSGIKDETASESSEPQKGSFFGISVESVVSAFSGFCNAVSGSFSVIRFWAASSREEQASCSLEYHDNYGVNASTSTVCNTNTSEATTSQQNNVPQASSNTEYTGFFASIRKALAQWGNWFYRGSVSGNPATDVQSTHELQDQDPVFGNTATKVGSRNEIEVIFSNREHESGIFSTRETVSLEEMGGMNAIDPDQNNIPIPTGYAEVLGQDQLQALKNQVLKSTWFKDSEENLNLSTLATQLGHADLARQAIKINGQKFKFKVDGKTVEFQHAQLSLSNDEKLKQFKEAFSEKKGAPLTDRETFEIIRLIDSNGRTSGFPSGESTIGHLLGNEPKSSTGENRLDQTSITWHSDQQKWNINYHISDSYLSMIFMKDDLGHPKYAYNFSNALRSEENKPEFQVARQYTCSYQPPLDPNDPNSKGDFEYTYSAQGYWLEDSVNDTASDWLEVA